MSRGRTAFTLVEALLAVTLVLLTLSALGQAQHAVHRALARRRAAADEARIARAFARFAADCDGFLDPGFRRGADDPAIDLRQQTGTQARGWLSFYVVEDARPGLQDVRRVTYEMFDGALVRRSDPPRGAGPHEPQRQETLISKISGLEFALDDGQSWTRDWRGRQGKPLGLQLRFVGGDGQERIWSRPFNGAALH